ncbi:hypothetical protein D3C84_942340 [compost metagenome]
MVPGAEVLSRIRTRIPSLLNHSASTSPVGPAPTISTSLRVISLFSSVPGSSMVQSQSAGRLTAQRKMYPAGVTMEQDAAAEVIACAMPLIVWLTRLNGFDGASCKPID